MESIGKLAGGIAHDFNNILTTIIGLSDLILMDSVADEEVRENIREIKKSARRAASLTHQLLAFSRKQVLQPEIVNLNELILDIKKMLRILISEDIELSTNLSSTLGLIKVDPGQIVQVIMNLLINARDAMLNGGRIMIKTENIYLDKFSCNFYPEIVPGQYVMLSVSDTGCGMNEETLKKVFEPFFSTKEAGKGTGLGLATVYGIIKQSGGYIYAYSELKFGTTFKIYLPETGESVNGVNEEPGNQKAFSGSERILFVEDDDSLRKTTCKMLKCLGYTLYQAGSGAQALQKYEIHRNRMIDLLITDIVMPGMNGRELADGFLARRPELKVLFISGYTDDIIAHHGVLEEGISFLAKPFSIYDLACKVRKILDEPGVINMKA
jgi:CheY-like chemotaxis protein